MKAETNETWSLTAFSQSKIDLKRLQDSEAQFSENIIGQWHYSISAGGVTLELRIL